MPKLGAHRTGDPITPSPDEVPALEKYQELVENSGFLEEMPPTAARAVRVVLKELAAGRGVAIVPYGEYLSTQQAANLLAVSRPFVTRLVDSGELPSILVGKHRRVALEDLLRYREERSDSRRRILRNLTADGQAMGLDY
jgi:excisionase family DNA binding protein